VIDAGRVGRPHGLDGSFHVTRPVGDVLAEGTEVEVAGRAMRVERRAGTAERPILRLEGCATRADAEALRGEALRVPDELLPLDEGEYWAHELEGCVVHDGPTEVGTVRRMLELPSCEALEVDRAGGGQVIVPLVRDAVRGVDVQARRIDVDMGFVGG
jgi:16S rRNA processing protein RimM